MTRGRCCGPALAVLVFLLAAADLGAAPAPWGQGRSRAEDLTIRLVTIEPGDPLYSWWGHTGLVVEDRRLGVSRFYNYGLFSFQQKNFVRNFIQGRLWFEVGAFDTARELAAYRSDNRTIRIQTLDLPSAQRLEMAAFLEWNIRPENRVYLYDHYRDNCATRVRDLIDRMVGGQLAAATAVPGRGTLRWHTRRFTAGHPLMNWLLMFLMSGVIDRPITRWQEMFLPTELERNVAALSYTDSEGRPRRLAPGEITFYTAVNRPPVAQQPPNYVPAALELGIGLGIAALLLGLWRSRESRAAHALRGFSAAYESALGLVLGLIGTMLAYMSLFTDHTVTYGNRNLFLANPLDLAVVPLAIAMAAGSRGAGRWLAGLWSLLATLSLVGIFLQIFPAIRQDNWLAVVTILPVQLGCAAAGWLSLLSRQRAAARPGRPRG